MFVLKYHLHTCRQTDLYRLWLYRLLYKFLFTTQLDTSKNREKKIGFELGAVQYKQSYQTNPSSPASYPSYPQASRNYICIVLAILGWRVRRLPCKLAASLDEYFSLHAGRLRLIPAIFITLASGVDIIPGSNMKTHSLFSPSTCRHKGPESGEVGTLCITTSILGG